ncbi:MAG: nitroreductase family protein [Lachnospiraceae bacterium]|nr:nitroreductase family protein [Lachnospiraceae bacterium]
MVVFNTNAKSPFLPVDNDARIAEICDTLSVGAAIQNILLEAQNMGLGTLWIANTCFAYRELVSYLQTDRQLVGAVAVGYPDEAPPQRPRKELTQIVEYRWQDG